MSEAIKKSLSEFFLKLIEEEQEMVKRQPKDKEKLRREIHEQTEIYLGMGGKITVLPPGQSTNLDPDEAWGQFKL
jgi:hypothetical protein